MAKLWVLIVNASSFYDVKEGKIWSPSTWDVNVKKEMKVPVGHENCRNYVLQYYDEIADVWKILKKIATF